MHTQTNKAKIMMLFQVLGQQIEKINANIQNKFAMIYAANKTILNPKTFL